MKAAARASIVGLGLECGPLCANVAQFPIQPSTQLLREHTMFLYMDRGDRLVTSLDEATLNVAKGQTATVTGPTAKVIRRRHHQPQRV